MFALLFAAFSAPSVGIAGMVVWQEDYGPARRAAAAAGKPLVVVIASGKHGYNQLSKSGMLHPEVQRLLAENYTSVYIDAAKEDRQYLVEAFAATQLPILVISDRQGAYQAYRHSGAMDKTELLSVLSRHAGKSELILRTSYSPPSSSSPSSPQIIRQASPSYVVPCVT